MMRRLLVLPVALSFVGTAAAQSTTRQKAEALVIAARASARAGDTDQALKQLEAARKADPKYMPGHLEYGLMLSARTDAGWLDVLERKKAADALKDASDLEPDNPIPYLELGRLRLKMPFMRIAAEALFRTALELAIKKGAPEVVGEIAYEIGQIYDRRYRTMAHRHMMTGDTKMLDPFGAQYEKDYVEMFLRNSAISIDDSGELDAAKAEEWYRQSLTAQPGHEGAAPAMAALLYEFKRYGEMAKVAHDASLLSPANSRIKLAEGLALLRLKKVSQADGALEHAVTLMNDRERNMVAALGPILRPGDARAYETLDAATRAKQDKAYWAMNDPLYLTQVNEQRLAFLGRVAYADLMYSTSDLKVRGALTDRGQIILRYGEPPVVATFQPDVQQKNDVSTMGRVTTLWWYPEPQLKFVFTGPPAMTSATFAGDFYGYADELRYSMPVRYDSLPGGLSKADTIPVQVARFRGLQPLTTRVEFHAAVPVRKLSSKAGAAPVSVETGFFLLNAARVAVVDQRDTVRADTSSENRTRSFSRQFAPGEYYYRVEALEVASMANARSAGGLSIVNFPVNDFSLSDILVGTELKNTDIKRRDDLDMDIIADNALNPDQTLGLYWETYGAKANKDGAVNLRVDISMTVLELERAPSLHIRLFGAIADKLSLSAVGDMKVTQGYDKTIPAPTGSDDRILNSINIQLGGLPAAQYLLEITMTDKETGKVAKSTHAVRVRRPQ